MTLANAEEPEAECLQALSDDVALMLTTDGELMLLIEDDEDNSTLVLPIGPGKGTLLGFKKAIEHLLTHIH